MNPNFGTNIASKIARCGCVHILKFKGQDKAFRRAFPGQIVLIWCNIMAITRFLTLETRTTSFSLNHFLGSHYPFRFYI